MKIELYYLLVVVVGTTCVTANNQDADLYEFFYKTIGEESSIQKTEYTLFRFYRKTQNLKAKQLYDLGRNWSQKSCQEEPYTNLEPKLRTTDPDSQQLADYIADREEKRQILCHLDKGHRWDDPETIEYVKEKSSTHFDVDMVRIEVKALQDHMNQPKPCINFRRFMDSMKYEIFGQYVESVMTVVQPLIKQIKELCFPIEDKYIKFNDIRREFEKKHANDWKLIDNMRDQMDNVFIEDKSFSTINKEFTEEIFAQNYKAEPRKKSFFGGVELTEIKPICDKFLAKTKNFAEAILQDDAELSQYMASREENKRGIRAYIYCKKARD